MHSLTRVLIIAVLLTALIIGAGEAAYFTDEDLLLQDNLIFMDRNGEMLRFFPDANGQRHLRANKDQIPEHLKKAFISIEDERFYSHSGIDLKAILRALKDNILHGRVVSGASTITQQTARLIQPHPRTLRGKLREMSMSSELEERLAKNEILEQYLNRVPLGPGITGVGLAANRYFDRSPSELSIAQAALLAALPKAPSYYNPYGKNQDKLIERKNVVLAKMASLGLITEEEYKAALDEQIIFRPKQGFSNKAPHLVEQLKNRLKLESGIQHTTIDLALQQDINHILVSHKKRLALRGTYQAATMVVRNKTMEVLSLIGSMAYTDEHDGFNNGATARRSAGSTLKPFLYAAALEQGYTASSLLEDVLRPYKIPLGVYSPDNFDRHQYGPVTMRTALGNSLNISSVRLLDMIRIDEGYDLMRQLRLMPEDGHNAGDYGLGLAIGNADVTLEGLVNAYATLANQGLYYPLRYLKDAPHNEPERIFSEQAAYVVTDILSDPSSRLITFGQSLSFPYKVAVKTGTSTSYRDGWAIGYTPDYTIGVWVGNFDGSPTEHISGAMGAVPIFKEVLRLLYSDMPPAEFDKPEGLVSVEVCGISGMRPGPKCTHRVHELFMADTGPEEQCSFHQHEDFYHELPTMYAGWLYDRDKRNSAGSFRLAGFSSDLETVFEDQADRVYPVDNTLQNTAQGAADPLKPLVRISYPLPNDSFVMSEASEPMIKLEGIATVALPYVDWFIDGIHLGRTGPPYQLSWELERGIHRIMVVDPDHKGDSIEVTVE